MPSYFLDSSAIVKRYVSEVGSAWVVQVMDLATGNAIHAASITAVEVVSALSRHARATGADVAAIRGAIARFRYDFDEDILVVHLGPELLNRAMDLTERHSLRGYDAVQLATAMDVNESSAAAGLQLTLVSADAELNAAALGEGLTVADPNHHP